MIMLVVLALNNSFTNSGKGKTIFQMVKFVFVGFIV